MTFITNFNYEIKFDLPDGVYDIDELKADVTKKIENFINYVMDEPDKIGKYVINVTDCFEGSKGHLIIDFISIDYGEVMYSLTWCTAC